MAAETGDRTAKICDRLKETGGLPSQPVESGAEAPHSMSELLLFVEVGAEEFAGDGYGDFGVFGGGEVGE